jgi:hypothetical protein
MDPVTLPRWSLPFYEGGSLQALMIAGWQSGVGQQPRQPASHVHSLLPACHRQSLSFWEVIWHPHSIGRTAPDAESRTPATNSSVLQPPSPAHLGLWDFGTSNEARPPELLQVFGDVSKSGLGRAECQPSPFPHQENLAIGRSQSEA